MTTDINAEIKDILNERNSIRERVRKISSNRQLLNNSSATSRLLSEINYFNSRLYEKVNEHEIINTAVLSKIERLNKSNKERQRVHTELKQTYQKNKNLGSGMEVANEDSSQRYRSVLKSILLKNSALIALYYYILMS